MRASPPSHSPLRVARLARGAAVQLGGKLVGRGAGFLAQMVVARVLGTAAYGLFGIGWTVLQLVGLVASLGLDHGAVLHASRRLEDGPGPAAAVLRRALILTSISGAALGLTLALSSPFLARHAFSKPELTPVLLAFSAGVVLVAGTRVAAAGTRVSQRMGYSTLAEDLVLPFTHLGLLVVLLALGWRLLAAVAAPLVAYAVAFAVALASLRVLFPASGAGSGRSEAPADPSTGRLLAFSVTASLSGVLGLLTLWADRLLVGSLLGKADTGIYMAASQISLLFAVVLSAFNTVFAPMIAELHGKGERRELESLYRISTKWGLYVTAPFFLVILAFPTGLLALLGEGYGSGALPLTLLAGGQMINLATGAVGMILVMSGRQNRLLALSALTLALNVILNLLWIPRFGLPGAALATTVSLAALFSTALFAVRRAPGVWPYDRRYLKGALAALVAGGVLLALRLGFPEPGAVHLALALLAAYGVFAGVIAVQGLDREDRELAARVLARTRGRSVREEGDGG